MLALPAVHKEIMKLPRAYIANVLYTMIGAPFQQWVNARIEERNIKVKEDKDLAIDMDEDIMRIF